MDWDIKTDSKFKVILKEGVINNNWSSNCEIETIKKQPEIINYSCNDVIYFKGKSKKDCKYLNIIYK